MKILITRCPSLNDLPPPPPGKTGWPWTEESPQLPDKMPDGSNWPKISIVTPSLNQDQFIEETIRSVLLQGYPDLEYILIDGGSSDNSLDIIKKYEHWFAYWISEPDKGQSNAINKGIDRCHGDIFAWLNSDDVHLQNSLAIVSEGFRSTGGNAIIAGDVIEFDDSTGEAYTIRQHDITMRNMVEFWVTGRQAWHQPGLFFPTSQVIRAGKLDETLHYLMDYDLLCRLLQVCPVEYLRHGMTRFRLHAGSKTINQQPRFRKEMSRVSHRYWRLVPGLSETSAYEHTARFLVSTASYQLRSGNFRTSADLLVELWRMDQKRTLSAVWEEIVRLAMGGRFTGRKVP